MVTNRFAIREAAIASFYDVLPDASERLSVRLDTLKMTDIAHAAATVYARGGIGNPRLVGFSGDKDVAVTIQDALFTTDSLAMLNGVEVTHDAQTIHRVDTIKIDTNDATTTKKLVELISVRVLDDFFFPVKYVDNTAITVAGETLTFDPSLNGKYVEIAYKTTIPKDKNNTFTVSSSHFGGTKKMVIDVIVRDSHTGNDYSGQLIADRVKIEEDFTFSFAPDGDPSVLDIPVQILKSPVGTDMYKLVLFNADDIEE